MKYKEKYLEIQKRLYKKQNKIQDEFCRIRQIVSYIEDSLDSRRSELSPELHEYLSEKLYEIWKIAFKHETFIG